MSTEADEKNKIREPIIETAVSFLKNNSVQRSSLDQKQKFLRSKGLSENEIQLAFERAGVFTTDPNSTVINFDISQEKEQSLVFQAQPKQQGLILSTFSRFKEILSSIAVISGVFYVIYSFYKRFVEPFLFGKKKRPIEKQIEEINNKVEVKINKLSDQIGKIHEEIVANNQSDLINRELSNFKNDLDAIKGLLLNRKQFANPLMMTSTIPQWQLQSQHHASLVNDKQESDSHSGSSETEVVVKNSDSSIEIM